MCSHFDTWFHAVIYITMVGLLPYLDYGDIIYDGANLKFLKKLQTLQNRGLRICNNERGHIPTVVLHQKCKVAQLTTRRTAHVRNFMYKKQICMELIDRRPINTRSHDATLNLPSLVTLH